MNKNIIWAFAGGPAIPNKMMWDADLVFLNHGQLTEIVKNRQAQPGFILSKDAERYAADPSQFRAETVFLDKSLTPA